MLMPSRYLAQESEIKGAPLRLACRGEYRMRGLLGPMILCIDDRENEAEVRRAEVRRRTWEGMRNLLYWIMWIIVMQV